MFNKFFHKWPVILAILICSFLEQEAFTQGVLPVNRYHRKIVLLDLTNENTSFGYSLRKIKSSFAGFSIRIRNGSNNAIGDVSFDNNEIVSLNSNVLITSQGTGSNTVGSTVSLSAFKGAATLFVTTWYDQSTTAYHATQSTASNQPELRLNTAGVSNTLPSLYFDGTNDHFIINQPIQNILDSGIRGTFLIAIKPTANNQQFSFGYRNTGTDWRWSFHINWSDQNLYFDAGEVCCATNRSIANGANINLWKQYSIIRGTSYKTIRINGAATGLNNSSATSTSQTGGQFWIGDSFGSSNTDGPYTGNMSEVLMFKTDLAIANLTILENEQRSFWGLL